MARCRSCQAEIIWAQTSGGKKIPLDAQPVVARGGFRLAEDRRGQTVALNVGTVYVSHFATCPNAGQHRKGRDG